MNGAMAIIPIALAFVGLFTIGKWLIDSLVFLVERARKRRSVKASTGTPAIVLRMDGTMEVRLYNDGTHQVEYFAAEGVDLVLGDIETDGSHISLTVERR